MIPDPGVLAFFLGGNGSPRWWGEAFQDSGPELGEENLVLSECQQRLVQRLAESLKDGGSPLIMQGPAGSGKTFFLRMAAGKAGKKLLSVRVSKILAEQENAGGMAVREALLRDRIPVFQRAEDCPEELFSLFMKEAAGWCSREQTLFCVETEKMESFAFYVELPAPDRAERLEIWKWMAREQAANREILFSCCYRRLKRHLEKRARRIPPRFSWEDLLLEERQKEKLLAAERQIRYRYQVFETWGLSEKQPYGNGVSLVFSGPSGTGKTMEAQVIAGDLGLELYRIDISQLVSKYIGETEKHISELFEKAKDINAVLFFDEADALFARRSEVSDANDRSANMETAHLLQKLEEYEGIVLLATNLKENIDEAFRRRIRFMIRFSLPDEATRRMLWEKVIPREAPLEREVDLDGLARCFELSGSAIKEIALNAAYMAAAEGGCIGSRHLAEAFRLYYGKLGKQLTGQEMEAFL